MAETSNPPPQPPLAASVHCMHIQIFNKLAVSLKKLCMPKIREKKSPIHENADANITRDFGDGGSNFRSRLPHTRTPTDDHTVSSSMVRLRRNGSVNTLKDEHKYMCMVPS